MPYGYYQMVRFLAFLGFGFLAAKSYQRDIGTEIFIYAALAVLFQPFFKISLGRELWNIVDLMVGVGLLISVVRGNKAVS